MSWNVRGLGSPVKRLAVTRTIKRLGADVVCLQETHFSPTSTPQFVARQFCHQYHATGSVYSRGVSILIKRDTQFSPLDVKTDPEGRFVFILCSLYGTKCILAGLYIPPPYSSSLLKVLADYVAKYPGVPAMVLGDFNNYLDYTKDKLISRLTGLGGGLQALLPLPAI